MNGGVPALIIGLRVKQDPSQIVSPEIWAVRAHAGILTFCVMLAEQPAAFETFNVTGKVAGPVPG